MAKKNNNRMLLASLSLIIITVVALQIQPASASDITVELSDLSISPPTIYAGNEITVKGEYSISSYHSEKVRLELLFDGDVVESITEYRSTGNYDVRFGYTPSSSSTGDHDIGIRARIYKNGEERDEDSITRTITIYSSGTTHDLEITSVISRNPVSPSEKFPVDVEISNTGHSEENNVAISAKIGSKQYISPAFSISPGERVTKTIYVSAPGESGNFELIIRAYNSYASAEDIKNIDVRRTYVSLTLKKTSANIGDWIEIYGYASSGLYASESAVNLYLDNYFSGTVPTRGNGYYSTKVKFDTPGSHQIKIMTNELTTTQFVYISPPQTYPYTPAQPMPQQIVIPSGNYTAIIVVTGESQYVVYPEAPKTAPVKGNISNLSGTPETKKDKYANSSFVNIDISTNELDTVQNSGNLLKITVTNHLGRNEKFSVSTDFEKKWTYIPGAEAVLNGEKKIFEIYFTPDLSGTFEGNVFVLENNKTLKTIPVSLFVAPRKEQEIKEASAISLFPDIRQIAILAAALIFVIFSLRYIGSRNHDALEPKMLPPTQNVSEILKAMSSPFSEKKESPESKRTWVNKICAGEPKNTEPHVRESIFFVPRDKIIM